MTMSVAGGLLAGGLARRLGGGDKGFKSLGGKTILSLIISRIENQVGPLILNANGDADRFSSYDLPVVADVIPDYAGPLAGILTGMEWMRDNRPDVDWIVSVPTDAPFIPMDLVQRLMGAIKNGAQIACAQSKGRSHPVVAIWPVSLCQDLRAAMVDDEVRKVDRWTANYQTAHVDFPIIEVNGEYIDPFFNANRADDIEEAERLYQLLAS